MHLKNDEIYIYFLIVRYTLGLTLYRSSIKNLQILFENLKKITARSFQKGTCGLPRGRANYL